jgi:pyruvate/2-oxoglutarate/acetoin dehydrogenase E1 component
MVMAEVTYRDAVAMAIAQEMRRDPNVVFLGEDIAAAGGQSGRITVITVGGAAVSVDRLTIAP